MCKTKSIRVNAKQNLKILAYNVEGLDRELDNPLFIDMIYEYDIYMCSLWDMEKLRFEIMPTRSMGLFNGKAENEKGVKKFRGNNSCV